MHKVFSLKLVFLVISAMIAMYMASGLIFLTLAVGLLTIYISSKTGLMDMKSTYKLPAVIITLCIVVSLIIIFHSSISGYGVLLERVHLPFSMDILEIIFWVTSLICGILAVFAIYIYIYMLMNQNMNFDIIQKNSSNLNDVTFKEFCFIFLCSFLTITICSQCSFLYPLNSWLDPNVYMQVTNGMMNGLMPYRDMLDHKGPITYFIHAIGALIDSKSFIGVYILEVVTASIFLYWCMRIIRLFKSDAPIIVIAPLSAIIYSSISFVIGDSCEEFCLPIIAYLIYSTTRHALTKTMPGVVESLVIGLLAAFVFWLKFSICGIFIGWYIPVFFQAIKENQIKKLIFDSLAVGLGLVVITAPILAFFDINNALDDLFRVYFGYNLFIHNDVVAEVSSFSIISNLLMGIPTLIKSSICCFLIFFMFLVLHKKHKTRLLFHLYCVFFCSYFFIFFSGGYKWTHYSFILMPYASIGLIFLIKHILPVINQDIIPSFFVKNKTISIVITSLISAFFICGATNKISYREKDYPQFEFAKIVLQYPNAKYLQLHGAPHNSFLTVTGLPPACVYFDIVNCFDKDVMMAYQDSLVQAGVVDFFVNYGEEQSYEKYNHITQGDYVYNNYPLLRYVAQKFYNARTGVITYHLYGLKEKPIPE